MQTNSQKKNCVKIIIAVVLVAAAVVAVCLIAGKTRNIDIHAFYNNYSDIYPSSVRASTVKYFEEYGYSYQNYDAGSSQTTQTEQILSTLSRNPGVIIVDQEDNLSTNSTDQIVDAASVYGTYVVFFNREVMDEPINRYDRAVFIGTKPEEAGIMQGKMIGEYLLEHYEEADLNHDGKISYIMFKGQEGNAEANARTKYSVETANEILTAAGYPELEFYDQNNPNRYVLDQNGSWSAAAGSEYMSTALVRYCDANDNMIELVIANNDNMAEGAISALQKVGYNVENGDRYIPVYGVDATESAKVLISKGCMTGTVLQDADEMGRVVVQICDNVLKGNDILYGLEDIPKDDGCLKLRIPYAEYTEN